MFLVHLGANQAAASVIGVWGFWEALGTAIYADGVWQRAAKLLLNTVVPFPQVSPTVKLI